MLPLPDWLLVLLPFSLTLSLRAAAWTYRLALPHWARKRSGVFILGQGERFEIQLSNQRLGKPEVPTPRELLHTLMQ